MYYGSGLAEITKKNIKLSEYLLRISRGQYVELENINFGYMRCIMQTYHTFEFYIAELYQNKSWNK